MSRSRANELRKMGHRAWLVVRAKSNALLNNSLYCISKAVYGTGSSIDAQGLRTKGSLTDTTKVKCVNALIVYPSMKVG